MIRLYLLRTHLLGCALVLSSAPLAAQVSTDSAWATALRRLTPGADIRVHAVGQGRITGRFREASGPTLLLESDGVSLPLRTNALDSLWVRGNAVKTGAIAGGFYGYLANELGCKDGGGDPCPEAIPLLALGGAAAGALLGALIGSTITKWHRRIP